MYASAGTKKRKPYTHLACQSCKDKHLKCDGKKPICGHCVAKNCECLYREERNRRKDTFVNKKVEEELREQIFRLQSELENWKKSYFMLVQEHSKDLPKETIDNITNYTMALPATLPPNSRRYDFKDASFTRRRCSSDPTALQFDLHINTNQNRTNGLNEHNHNHNHNHNQDGSDYLGNTNMMDQPVGDFKVMGSMARHKSQPEIKDPPQIRVFETPSAPLYSRNCYSNPSLPHIYDEESIFQSPYYHAPESRNMDSRLVDVKQNELSERNYPQESNNQSRQRFIDPSEVPLGHPSYHSQDFDPPQFQNDEHSHIPAQAMRSPIPSSNSGHMNNIFPHPLPVIKEKSQQDQQVIPSHTEHQNQPYPFEYAPDSDYEMRHTYNVGHDRTQALYENRPDYEQNAQKQSSFPYPTFPQQVMGGGQVMRNDVEIEGHTYTYNQ